MAACPTTKNVRQDAARRGYVLGRMGRLGQWLEQGFLELDGNAAERAIRPLALGHKNWLFTGSERGGRSAAIAYTLTYLLIALVDRSLRDQKLRPVSDHRANNNKISSQASVQTETNAGILLRG